MILALPEGEKESKLSEPFLSVGSSVVPSRIDDLEVFARKKISIHKNVHDIKGFYRRIAGKPAYEITAKAKDIKSKKPLVVYQLVVLHELTYYVVLGIVSEDRFYDYLTEFRAVAESLEIL